MRGAREYDFDVPDEVHKGGHMAVQDGIFNVEQPAIKAVEGCNVGQLQRCSLCALFCPQQQLTQDGPASHVCDEGAKDLQCAQQTQLMWGYQAVMQATFLTITCTLTAC